MTAFFVPAVLFVTSALAEKRSVVQLATMGDIDLTSKVHAAEHRIWETFQALPKNEYGRLDPGTAAVALQRYFARERQWRVDTDSAIVQDAFKKVVGRGFSSKSLTEAMSAVERAILNEPRERLLETFASSNFSCSDPTACSADEIGVILTAYMKAYVIPGRELLSPGELADELQRTFDLQKGYSRRNPFKSQTYSFEDALSMVEHYEAELEKQSRDLCELRSSESESSCFASGRHHSVCCVSPCENILSELESKLQAPVVSPDRLLRVVSKLSFASGDDVGHLPKKLQYQLESIGERYGDDIPLHGDDVAEWLHNVFPSECPLPEKPAPERTEASADANVQPARRWSVQDIARITVFGLIVFAMLSRAMAQWQTACGALKGTSLKADQKPQSSASTTFV